MSIGEVGSTLITQGKLLPTVRTKRQSRRRDNQPDSLHHIRAPYSRDF